MKSLVAIIALGPARVALVRNEILRGRTILRVLKTYYSAKDRGEQTSP